MNKEYYRKLFPLLTDYELIQIEIEDDIYGKVTQIYKKPKPINESIILKYYQFIKNKIKI